MNYSIQSIIRAYAAPNCQLSCTSRLWRTVTDQLRLRTRDRHESGAFLLGKQKEDPRKISAVVYYDDLDQRAYESGICIVRGPAFSKLWTICRERGLSVIADVHVHPTGAGQSYSDKTNPTISTLGHVSIIVPNFARPPVRIHELGIYRYKGNYEWDDVGLHRARELFYVGWFA